MKVKRYFAPDMRTGIRLVREELGSDAIILSNQRIAGGIEIVATVEYDAAPPPAPARPRPVSGARSEGGIRMGGPERARALQKALGEAYAQRALSESGGASEAAAATAANRRLNRDEDSSGQARAGASQDFGAMQAELRSMRELLNHCFETLVQDKEAARAPDKVMLCERFVQLGLERQTARSLAEMVPGSSDAERDWKRGLAVLSKRLPVLDQELLIGGGTFALVGPSGAGKTTTIGKLATRYALKYGSQRVALVTADSFRIAAHDQLRTFARILDVPLRVVDEQNPLPKVLKGLRDRDLVLIDTAGLGAGEAAFERQLFALRGCPQVRSVLVMPAAAQRRVLERACRAWSGLQPSACILTKLDECGSLGESLDVVMRYQLPVAYTTDGQTVPHDLHVARAHSLVSRAVALVNEQDEARPRAGAAGRHLQPGLRAHG